MRGIGPRGQASGALRPLAICGMALALLAVTVSGPAPAAASDTVPPAPAPLVLEPVDATTPGALPPTAAGITEQIGALARRGLYDGSILVVDPGTDTVLYSRAADTPRIPASTTKLRDGRGGPACARGRRPDSPRSPTARGARCTSSAAAIPPSSGRRAATRSPAAAPPCAISPAPWLRRSRPRLQVDLVYDASAFRGPELGPGWPSSFPAAGVAAPVTALVVDGGRVSAGANARVGDPARQAATVFAGLPARAGRWTSPRSTRAGSVRLPRRWRGSSRRRSATSSRRC